MFRVGSCGLDWRLYTGSTHSKQQHEKEIEKRIIQRWHLLDLVEEVVHSRDPVGTTKQGPSVSL